MTTKQAQMVKDQAETINQLTIKLAEANAEIERFKRLMPRAVQRAVYVSRPVDPEVLRRREAMAAAKAAAMAGGCSVRVEL